MNINSNRKYGWTILMALVSLIYLSPLFWVLSTSFKAKNEFFTYPPVFIPETINFSHYIHGLSLGGYQGIINSLIIATGATVFSLVLSIPAAYSFAHHNVGGQNLSFWVLSIRMLPPVAVALPIFLMYRNLGLLDSYLGMILIHSIIDIPFAVWLLKGFFEGIPYSLIESARVDGCNLYQAFYKIGLPLVAPGVATAALFCFIFSWNEFIFALILTRKSVMPITVVLPNMIGGHEVLWAEIASLALMASFPVVILAFLLQRHIVRGLTMGALKQ